MAAALVRARSQIGGLVNLLVLAAAVLGGVMIPSFVMPEFLRQISPLTPHFWAHQGYLDVIVRGVDTLAVLPRVLILLAFAAACFGVAAWRFRFDEDTRPAPAPLIAGVASRFQHKPAD